MKNLEQIRAAAALRFWHPPQGPREASGVGGGDVVSKLPSMILANGLLATLAFATAKGGGHELLMVCVMNHICSEELGIIPRPQSREPGLKAYIELLTQGNHATSLRLQMATTEAISFLSFLKRFAP